MSRGYLWVNLQEDILEEFLDLMPSMPVTYSFVDEVRYHRWAASELKRLPNSLVRRIKHLNYHEGRMLRETEKPAPPKKRPKPRIPPAPTRNQLNYDKRKASALLTWTQTENRYEAFFNNSFIGYYIVLDNEIRASLRGEEFKICSTEKEARQHIATSRFFKPA